jgi:hypothetical protein
MEGKTIQLFLSDALFHESASHQDLIRTPGNPGKTKETEEDEANSLTTGPEMPTGYAVATSVERIHAEPPTYEIDELLSAHGMVPPIT